MTDRLPIRPAVSEEVKTAALETVMANLEKRLRQHGRDGYAGKAEALGVITEEFWELVEASDVAVGCIWLVATIKAKKEADRKHKEEVTLNFGAKKP